MWTKKSANSAHENFTKVLTKLNESFFYYINTYRKYPINGGKTIWNYRKDVNKTKHDLEPIKTRKIKNKFML